MHKQADFFVDIPNLFCKLRLCIQNYSTSFEILYSNDLLQDDILHLYGKKLSINQVKVVVGQNV